MFPSIDNSCDTFIYNPNPNPNYIHETSPFLFSHFPSPFLDDYTDSLPPPHHHHIFTTTNYDDINISPNIKMATPSQPSSSLLPPPHPPPLKKMRTDRHSKIFTAQGVRARRMRLPLRIARRFFDLQDILGFDKASKTIEWLLAKSKGAIKELAKNIPSSTSGKGDCGTFSDSSEGEKNKRKLVKAKETRDKARARARERTREKMMMRSVEKMGQLGSSTSSNPNSSFDSGSPHQSSLNKQFSNVGIDGDLSNPIFDHENIIIGGDNNNFLEFLENWDIVENEMIGY